MTRLLAKTLKTLILYSNGAYKDSIRCCNTMQHLQPNPVIFQDSDLVSQKLLKVAVIGMPNAGKSTFINNLMDRKVCPTSGKVHTTRTKARAIFTEGNSQIIFLDTPGLVTVRMKNKYNLERSFLKDGETCLKECNTIGVIHDVSSVWTRDRLDIKIIKLLEKYHDKPSFLVLNKVDILKSKRKLLELTRLITMNCIDGKPIPSKREYKTDEHSNNRGWSNFKEIFMVSSLTGNGLSEVKDYLIKSAKPDKWIFPADTWSDQTPEKIIIDTVKATLLDFLPQEIPYQMNPIMELYEMNEDGVINTVVLVECESDRIAQLAAGAGDGRLRQITESAQRDLQDVFQQFIRIKIVLQPPKNIKK